MEELLECGRVMKLHSLNAAQWNGCIVAVNDRAIESTTTRYVSEVVLGEKEGKLIKVKRTNLMEIAAPSEVDIEKASQVGWFASSVMGDLLSETFTLGSPSFEKTVTIIKMMISFVPSCCVAWHLFALTR